MRTALRTAIAVAALTGAVLAPAAGAFAATPFGAPVAPVAPVAPSPSPSDSDSASASDEAPSVPKPGDTPKSSESPKTPGVPKPSETSKAPEAPEAPEDGAKGEQDHGPDRRALADGGRAELFAEGPHRYRAVLYAADGERLGELTADGRGAGDEFGRLFVTLDTEGALRSWINLERGTEYQEVRKGCTVTRTAPAYFDGVDMALSNSPEKGPVATLTENGKVLAVLDRDHDTALYGGARIKGLLDPAPALPTFQMRVHEGSLPWAGLRFPAVPEGCGTDGKTGGDTGGDTGEKTTTTVPVAHHETRTGAGAPQTSAVRQTSVVPKGSVAAGAEPVAADGTDATGEDRTLLFAGGAALVGAGAAGVALALFRRRGETA